MSTPVKRKPTLRKCPVDGCGTNVVRRAYLFCARHHRRMGHLIEYTYEDLTQFTEMYPCSECGGSFPAVEMARDSGQGRKPRILKVCLKCHKMRRRYRYTAVRYGLTATEYSAMVEAQGGLCATCGGTNPSGNELSVDHDHATGKIRELLCINCNRGLGYAKDNIETLKSWIEYLERHS